MSTAVKIILACVGALFLVFIISVFSVIGIHNDCVHQESGLKAQYSQNQNNYANYFDKLKEAAQVPDMYASKLKDLYDGTMKGRYGAEGSKAMFQFIKEQNPTLDPKMFVQLQEIIEAGRNSFEADQKTLLDKKRVYENTLGSFPGSFFAGMMGFPKIDLKSIDIVINEETAKAFETKRAGPINLKN
jgi:hypothetical protein